MYSLTVTQKRPLTGKHSNEKIKNKTNFRNDWIKNKINNQNLIMIQPLIDSIWVTLQIVINDNKFLKFDDSFRKSQHYHTAGVKILYSEID